MAWMIRIVVATSFVSGVIGIMLARKVYAVQEIFAGLLSIAVLLTTGTLLVVGLVVLQTLWQYIVQWMKTGLGGRE
jgi:hypothetical protein